MIAGTIAMSETRLSRLVRLRDLTDATSWNPFDEIDRLQRRRQRILEFAPPQVRAAVSATAGACFEGRLIQDRPATVIAAELGITTNAVLVHDSRVSREIRRRCVELEEELGDGSDSDLS